MEVPVSAPPIFRNGCLQGVIDGDDSEDVLAVIEDGEGEQVIVGHQVADVNDVVAWVSVDWLEVRHITKQRRRVDLKCTHEAQGSDQSVFRIDAVNGGERFAARSISSDSRTVDDSAMARYSTPIRPPALPS